MNARGSQVGGRAEVPGPRILRSILQAFWTLLFVPLVSVLLAVLFVFGRGIAQFKVVKVGGAQVCKARNNVADIHDSGGVFMYRDSSISPVFDLRRKLKAVLDVLDGA